jgi:hypothetical protein
MTIEHISISTTFPDRNKRFEVVFTELLKVVARAHTQHPDRYVADLIDRAKLIAASFPDSGVK